LTSTGVQRSSLVGVKRRQRCAAVSAMLVTFYRQSITENVSTAALFDPHPLTVTPAPYSACTAVCRQLYNVHLGLSSLHGSPHPLDCQPSATPATEIAKENILDHSNQPVLKRQHGIYTIHCTPKESARCAI